MALFWAVAALMLSTAYAGIEVGGSWPDGDGIKVLYNVKLTAQCDLNGWKVKINFGRAPRGFHMWNAAGDCTNQAECIVSNAEHNGNVGNGGQIDFGMTVTFPGADQPHTTADWNDGTCGNNPNPTGRPNPTGNPNPTGRPNPGKYNYGEVIGKSILFFEAQRSGRLPGNNRVPWRGDSAVGDGSDVGKDLTGGWYDAGDHVKFNFPMTSTVTMLAWGMIRYKDAYQHAGEWDKALDSIKWPLDYFLKCWDAGSKTLYGQVGHGETDHAWWGRPEDLSMWRPAYALTPAKPGSDLAGETSAAFSAASVVFRDSDPGYADRLKNEAKTLYAFADQHRAKYQDSITDAKDYYGSWGYHDELAWAAAWLYNITGESHYLDKAKQHLGDAGAPTEMSWDSKGIGAAVLVHMADPGFGMARDHINGFIEHWRSKVPYTPKGLAWLRKWGACRYAANAAFSILAAADIGIDADWGRDFARRQINYMLGDGGRSYVVGFGNNPPQRPHHKAASCNWAPAKCDWGDFHNPGPNPHVLQGALVGGPDQNDNYQDRRDDYVANEVACDYNSGFQGAVAGVLSLDLKGF